MWPAPAGRADSRSPELRGSAAAPDRECLPASDGVPRAQQAFAHRGNGAVQTAEQRGVVCGPGKQWLDQFKIAYRDRVQHQAVLALVEADAIHMVERATLRGANVMQNGSRRGRRCRSV